MFKKQLLNSRVLMPLFAIFAVFILSSLGIVEAQDMTTTGMLLAGVGNIDVAHINDLLVKQGDAFEKRMKQIDRLDKEVAELSIKANRKRIFGGSGSYDHEESKSDLATLIRSRGEVKGMFSGSGPDGGWTVAPVLADGIGSIVRDASALRELVTFIPIESGDTYEEVISVTPVGAKWVGETEARPKTATPKLVKVVTNLHEEYAEPVISQRLADDSGTAMVDFLVNESSISFSEAEELALFYGDGINKPSGLDTIPTEATADATRAFGTIQHIPTGASGNFGTSPFDAVKTVFYTLRAGYRKNAKWVCNSATALELSKLKDGQGNYLWDDGNVKDGTPATLLGKPVVICETAPGIEADAKALWFGDWDQAMRGIERPGNKVLLDPYSDKPNVVVYVYCRVGFQMRNSNAVKCLKFSAS
ncbi:phage major capsid protein [Methylobacter sp. BBA5.1]|uniref:phage major capsid protein n=1 Tax=Methylobacter sp. BBA5.1 TaxID=1495064 RepID=UPI00068A68ED|nr:phage major capsid protein [Methylobacter sp. BBA5.1]